MSKGELSMSSSDKLVRKAKVFSILIVPITFICEIWKHIRVSVKEIIAIFGYISRNSLKANACLNKDNYTKPTLVDQHIIEVVTEPQREPNEPQRRQAVAQRPQWRGCSMLFRFFIVTDVSPNLHLIVNDHLSAVYHATACVNYAYH